MRPRKMTRTSHERTYTHTHARAHSGTYSRVRTSHTCPRHAHTHTHTRGRKWKCRALFIQKVNVAAYADQPGTKTSNQARRWKLKPRLRNNEHMDAYARMRDSETPVDKAYALEIYECPCEHTQISQEHKIWPYSYRPVTLFLRASTAPSQGPVSIP